MYDALTSEKVKLDGLSAIDWKLLNLATSGRINDFIGAASALNQNPMFWLTGKGIGGLFEVIFPNGTTWVTHYSHFTPISYVFLGGSVMLFAVYGKLTSLLLYSMKNINNFYNMLFIYFFIMALIGGAIYFTDPFIWMFIGVVVYQKKLKVKSALV